MINSTRPDDLLGFAVSRNHSRTSLYARISFLAKPSHSPRPSEFMCHASSSRKTYVLANLRLFLLLLFFYPVATLAAEPPDAVELMKAEYVGHFKDLPPARKCTPDDAKGAWKESAIFESAGMVEMSAQKAQGPKYLAFGEYNTLIWQRTQASLSAGPLVTSARGSNLQYIATAAGMLYVYKTGTLTDSLMCFIATEPKQKIAKDTLMLARPVEKDKPLLITLYEPLR